VIIVSKQLQFVLAVSLCYFVISYIYVNQSIPSSAGFVLIPSLLAWWLTKDCDNYSREKRRKRYAFVAIALALLLTSQIAGAYDEIGDSIEKSCLDNIPSDTLPANDAEKYCACVKRRGTTLGFHRFLAVAPREALRQKVPTESNQDYYAEIQAIGAQCASDILSAR